MVKFTEFVPFFLFCPTQQISFLILLTQTTEPNGQGTSKMVSAIKYLPESLGAMSPCISSRVSWFLRNNFKSLT